MQRQSLQPAGQEAEAITDIREKLAAKLTIAEIKVTGISEELTMDTQKELITVELIMVEFIMEMLIMGELIMKETSPCPSPLRRTLLRT